MRGAIDDDPDDWDDADRDDDFDPDRIMECAYWRCGELFEAKSTNHIFCRKACRSRQRKWERSVHRNARRKRG
ncbi:MAG: hypothetical protein HKN26_10635 [Acidimicrobiales bacterium]|nr:hypothetical protein [Acidimicrobiales bacterium]